MWRKSKPYFMVLPAVAITMWLGGWGIIQGLLISFGYDPSADQQQLTGHYYVQLMADPSFIQGLSISLLIAFWSTFSSGVLGMLLAATLFAWRQRVGELKTAKLQLIFLIPLAVPHLAAAYSIFLLFTQSGWLSRIFYHLGWLDELSQFPVLVHEPYGIAIFFTYLWKETPFFVLMLYPVLARVHGEWYAVAKMNGAGPIKYFVHVLLPLCRTAWLKAALIVFAFTFTAFEVPYLLGMTEPKFASVYSVEWFMGEWAERPKALAAGMILFFIVLMIGCFVYLLNRRHATKTERGWL